MHKKIYSLSPNRQNSVTTETPREKGDSTETMLCKINQTEEAHTVDSADMKVQEQEKLAL